MDLREQLSQLKATMQLQQLPQRSPGDSELDSRLETIFQRVIERNGLRPMQHSTVSAPSISTCEVGCEAMEVEEEGDCSTTEAVSTAPCTPTPSPPLVKEEPKDPEEPESPTVVECGREGCECGLDADRYADLEDEFVEWIYMKSMLMKRDKAFITMLPGLMQRWLKEKKITHVPCLFIDGLTKAAIERVKPSDVETQLADQVAEPECRSRVKTLNEAIQGEVTTFREVTVKEWVEDRASRVYPKWFTFWLGLDWNDYYFKVWMPSVWLPVGLWVLWILLHCAVAAITGEPMTADVSTIMWMGWGPSGFGIKWIQTSWYGWITWLLTWLQRYSYYAILRRGLFRTLYHAPDFVEDGFYRVPEGVRIFNSGNVKSQ